VAPLHPYIRGVPPLIPPCSKRLNYAYVKALLEKVKERFYDTTTVRNATEKHKGLLIISVSTHWNCKNYFVLIIKALYWGLRVA
jgi:hypothetical protein